MIDKLLPKLQKKEMVLDMFFYENNKISANLENIKSVRYFFCERLTW